MPEGPFLVVGLARSGAAAARLLAARGEQVAGVDSGHPEEAEGLAQAGVEVNLDADGTALLDGVATVVKSPGVPAEAPVIAAARERGIAVTGELELAWRALPNLFVAVTGTNGKTTTAELIGHLLSEAGEPVAVAGNVGTPLASLVGEVDEEATVVCEASSFQLENCEAFAPELAVFLNLAPDHLDRHRSLDAYLEAKLRVFANQGPEDVAIVNADDPALVKRELGGEAQLVLFSTRGADAEITLDAGEIRWRGAPLIRAEELAILGPHNVANAMAAAAAALSLGVAPDAVAAGLRSFEGVGHRLEPVAAADGVLFVNDSKATNVSAALAAIASFEGGVHLILGGRAKGESFEPLGAAVAERCAAAYVIGEAAEEIVAALAPATEAAVPVHRVDGLELAVSRAAAAATAGQVVLLAPACASFDAYADFEQRGEHFRRLVEELAS
ncbi:MAG: UDP-N-acetylmuramoyl-L-alanine--D-glutamate ligase [Solirubrobacterales bacterium]